MTEPENFLTRWSRRKREPEEQPAVAASEATPQKPVEEGQGVEKQGAEGVKPVDPAPAFDPATLPSLDSIGEKTDISVFLKAGVPGDLRLAALRRAWVTDPAIRDFKGLAENDWDFTMPNETMGFGTIDPGFDTKKMLSEVFGETPRTAAPAQEAPAEVEKTASTLNAAPTPVQRRAVGSIDTSLTVEASASEVELVHRNKDVAAQSDDRAPDDAPIARRRPQGGALPQ